MSSQTSRDPALAFAPVGAPIDQFFTLVFMLEYCILTARHPFLFVPSFRAQLVALSYVPTQLAASEGQTQGGDFDETASVWKPTLCDWKRPVVTQNH
eukprot:2586042-Amphidinium_carterae.1